MVKSFITYSQWSHFFFLFYHGYVFFLNTFKFFKDHFMCRSLVHLWAFRQTYKIPFNVIKQTIFFIPFSYIGYSLLEALYPPAQNGLINSHGKLHNSDHETSLSILQPLRFRWYFFFLVRYLFSWSTSFNSILRKGAWNLVFPPPHF